MPIEPDQNSYRDPAGFVFEKDGIIYRQINHSYQPHYQKLKSSGLYQELIGQGLLLPHEEVNLKTGTNAYCIIRPEQIHVITRPNQWTYDMLKDAAELTLKIQDICLKYAMTLKDAHPSNVQFIGGKPIFIDSLSFEIRTDNEPWIAYRQYCESFLLPLVIGHYSGTDSTKLLAAWPKGIPLEMGSTFLPIRARLNLHWSLHIFLNGRIGRSRKTNIKKKPKLTEDEFKRLIQSLKIATRKCKPRPHSENWINYSKEAKTRGRYSELKTDILLKWKTQLQNIASILDLGANTGEYAQLLAGAQTRTIQIESDADSCNESYRKNKQGFAKNTDTLCMDFEEFIGHRNSRLKRSIASDVVLCLGLLHHLLYKSNIPISYVVETLKELTSSYLIIEYISPEDDVIDEYFNLQLIELRMCRMEDFDEALKQHFNIIEKVKILDSTRLLYLCKRS